MSVRLTLRLRSEQECIVDCATEGLQRVTIALELADDVDRGGDVAALEGDGPGVAEDEAVDAAGMSNAGYTVEGEERSAIVYRDWQRRVCSLSNIGLGSLGQGQSSGGLMPRYDIAKAKIAAA